MLRQEMLSVCNHKIIFDPLLTQNGIGTGTACYIFQQACVRKDFELDLVLRNNLTTPDHPLGIYHPHEEFHHIKKENIGLIEVMGLAILPGRLKKELEAVEEKLLSGEDMTEDPLTKSHAKWAADIAANYEITAENVKEIVQKETGIVFSKVLEQAGVYKRTPEGKEAFLRFINQV